MDVLISDPFYSSLFLLLALILVFLEVFVPSAGILSVIAVGSAALGIWGFIEQGRELWAVGAILGFLGFVVFVVRFALRRFQLAAVLAPDVKTVSIDSDMGAFIGKEGVAITPLRPAGVAEIDGRRVDVVTSGRFVERDRRVRVVDTTGNRVVVREILEEEDEGAKPNGLHEEGSWPPAEESARPT